MPNWCANYVEVTNEDPAKIRELFKAMKEGRFLGTVIPVPEELTDTVAGSFGDAEQQKALEERTQRNVEKYGYGNWYDFCVGRWGTKWEVDTQGDVDMDPSNTIVTASFDSAWSPPLGVYEELVEQGYSVRAYYYESGMSFAGIWDNGDDDFYQDWGDAQGAKDTLPEELDEFFAISESQAEWEAENEDTEELTEWIRDGAEKRQLIDS